MPINKVRRELKKQGFYIKKSSVRNWSYDNQGEYRIRDNHLNVIVATINFNMDFEDVFSFITEDEKED